MTQSCSHLLYEIGKETTLRGHLPSFCIQPLAFVFNYWSTHVVDPAVSALLIISGMVSVLKQCWVLVESLAYSLGTSSPSLIPGCDNQNMYPNVDQTSPGEGKTAWWLRNTDLDWNSKKGRHCAHQKPRKTLCLARNIHHRDSGRKTYYLCPFLIPFNQFMRNNQRVG